MSDLRGAVVPQLLPKSLTTQLTKLTKSNLQLLQQKQEWLQKYSPSFPSTGTTNKSPSFLKHALSAVLVFAQEEAGTAVCISSSGLILTCSHCVAEDSAELEKSVYSWLIFASGQLVKAQCIAWDQKRDLALCEIVAAQEDASSVSPESDLKLDFPSLHIADIMPRIATPLLCIGHPGADDLESVVPGVKTNYDTLYVSQGKYRGYSRGQDIEDNEEIGALKHDCWTYWGHSGAPLINIKNGEMIGLHSSWDDTTGMRRGIGLKAIHSFLRENLSRANTKIRGASEVLNSLAEEHRQ